MDLAAFFLVEAKHAGTGSWFVYIRSSGKNADRGQYNTDPIVYSRDNTVSRRRLPNGRSGHAITQRERQGEHPLPVRHVRDHEVDQVRGLLGHAPARTARTEPPALGPAHTKSRAREVLTDSLGYQRPRRRFRAADGGTAGRDRHFSADPRGSKYVKCDDLTPSSFPYFSSSSYPASFCFKATF